MRRLKSGKAFTLVEVLVTVLIFTVIMSGVYAAFIAGLRSWTFYEESITYKNEVRRAMAAITTELREANNVLVATEKTSVRINFYRPKKGVVSYVWVAGGKDANTITRIEGPNIKVIARDIQYVNFTNLSDSVVVDIKSNHMANKTDGSQIRLIKKVSLRQKTKAYL